MSPDSAVSLRPAPNDAPGAAIAASATVRTSWAATVRYVHAAIAVPSAAIPARRSAVKNGPKEDASVCGAPNAPPDVRRATRTRETMSRRL